MRIGATQRKKEIEALIDTVEGAGAIGGSRRPKSREELRIFLSALAVGLSMKTAASIVPVSPEDVGHWAEIPEIAAAMAVMRGRLVILAAECLEDKLAEGYFPAVKFVLERRTQEFGENPFGTADTLEREESYL